MAWLLSLPMAGLAESDLHHTQLESGETKFYLEQDNQLYVSEPRFTEPDFDNPSQFLYQLNPVDAMSPAGGVYWYRGTISNLSDNTEYNLSPTKTSVDRFDFWVIYPDGDIVHDVTGYLHQATVNFNHVIELSLPKGRTVEYWARVEGRYNTGQLRMELVEREESDRAARVTSSVTLLCLGIILGLSFYNFFIYAWSRHKSYFYYALYLAITFVGWAAVFNIVSNVLGIYSLHFLFTCFFLNISANIKFYLHFLDLHRYYPRVTMVSYGVFYLSIAAFISQFFVSTWLTYSMVNVLSAVWLILGLLAGILRFKDGYKPARFFILGFAVFVFGAAISLLPYFGMPPLVDNAYMTTLVCQALDSILLALALADRINVLRQERQQALERAREADHNANMVLTKANETLLEANVKLKTSLDIAETEKKRKDEFIMTVSHELKTPLNSISSSIDSISTTEDMTEIHQHLKYMRHGTDRLNAHVMHIVMLAETDNQHLVVHNRPFQTSYMADKLISVARSSLIEKDVELSSHIAQQTALAYKGDFHLIFHMILPIVENACHYTHKGHVTISFNTFKYEQANTEGGNGGALSQGADGMEVVVTDTGVGIPESKLHQIFGSFAQLGSGYERKFEGLGLGLTVASRIAEYLNASISVESRENTGSSFSLRIPLECLDDEINGVQVDLTGNALVVEDNLVNSKVMVAILDKLGVVSTVAENGEVAVEKFDPSKYDFILMDLQMPVMDGFRATELIRNIDASIPIIAVTANTDSEARTRCFDLGIDEIIEKPIRKSDVQRVLTRFR